MSDYVIAPPRLCDKFTTIRVAGTQVLGYPMCISNDRYHRNALLFNFCALLAPSTDATTFQPAVYKISSVFRLLEEEQQFLSTRETRVRGRVLWLASPRDARRPQALLAPILRSLFEQLSTRGSASLRLTPGHELHVAVAGPRRAVPSSAVGKHHVPVRVQDVDSLPTDEWGLTLQRVLPHVDGVNHVAKIARCAGVGDREARACIRHLARERCVVLADVFQYSNCYAAAAGLRRLAADASLQRDCLGYVTLSGHSPPRASEVLALYASLRGGTSVQRLCRAIQRRRIPVDERRLVTFGLIHGIIRRVRLYPVRRPVRVGSPGDGAAAGNTTRRHRGLPAPQPLDMRSIPGAGAAGSDGSGSYVAVAAAAVAAEAARVGHLGGSRRRRSLLVDAAEAARVYEEGSRDTDAREEAGGAKEGEVPLPHDALDGSQSMDALCAELMRSFSELFELMRGDPGCVLVYK